MFIGYTCAGNTSTIRSLLGYPLKNTKSMNLATADNEIIIRDVSQNFWEERVLSGQT